MAELIPVLLVTSRFATLDFVHNTLTAPGRDYEVRTVASAEEAILALRRSSYSLLVSEQQLPGISGAEMAQKIKKMEPKIPIVVIAANSDQRQQVADAEIESVYAVEQPLTEVSLIDTVRMALQNNEVVDRKAPAKAQRVDSPEGKPADGVQMAVAGEAPAQGERKLGDVTGSAKPADGIPAAKPQAKFSQGPDQGRTSTQIRQKSGPVDVVPEPATRSSGGISAAVRGRLELLLADTGANQVMLATMGGDVLHIVGAQQANGLAKMATAVAANMAGSFDLAEILDSAEPLAIHYQAGEKWELLCANVGRKFVLAILFAARAGRGQIGTAWIFTRRAVKDLGRLLAESIAESSSELPSSAEMGPRSESDPRGEVASAEKPVESLPAAVANGEDLDRFWEEALSGTDSGEETSGAISLEEARRLGLVPPDFDLDNQ